MTNMKQKLVKLKHIQALGKWNVGDERELPESTAIQLIRKGYCEQNGGEALDLDKGAPATGADNGNKAKGKAKA